MDLGGAIDLKKETPNPNEPHLRLLVCNTCKRIDELPDYEGRPEDDHLLTIVIENYHTTEGGTPHFGNLLRIPIKQWAVTSVRNQILKQIREGSGGISELDPDFYDTKSTFGEDALRCFSDHLRPKGRCVDWHDSKKKLVPKTAALRKDLGLTAPDKLGGKQVYLCDFCPAAVFMHTKARDAAGLYK